jgi:hypothetical protein
MHWLFDHPTDRHVLKVPTVASYVRSTFRVVRTVQKRTIAGRNRSMYMFILMNWAMTKSLWRSESGGGPKIWMDRNPSVNDCFLTGSSASDPRTTTSKAGIEQSLWPCKWSVMLSIWPYIGWFWIDGSVRTVALLSVTGTSDYFGRSKVTSTNTFRRLDRRWSVVITVPVQLRNAPFHWKTHHSERTFAANFFSCLFREKSSEIGG